MSEQRTVQFWIYLAVFEVAFGAAIFLATRHYYTRDTQPTPVAAERVPVEMPASNFTPQMLDTLSSLQPDVTDPAEVSRRADQYFADQQYVQAVEWYKKLLAFAPDDVRTLNNLGLTLHYLGRSEEALEYLNKGVAADPAHQRIWLTLGFVNSDLGNVDAARSALTTAFQMNPENSIGQSAANMLARLP